MSTDKIWIQDFKVIFNKPIDFFPTKTQTNEERLNSIVRLSLYISLLLSVYHSNLKYLTIFIFMLFLTYIIYSNHPNNNINPIEKLDGKIDTNTPYPTQNSNPLTCTKPTIANPFMNFTMADYMTFDSNGNTVDRPPACDQNDPSIKTQIDSGFDNDLYKDVSDIFGKMNSQRNFFTTPSTSIVNDQESFQNWLYKNPQTCKENQDSCQPYEDIRSNRRFVQYDTSVNPVDTKRNL
jgi:hypothetical protein